MSSVLEAGETCSFEALSSVRKALLIVIQCMMLSRVRNTSLYLPLSKFLIIIEIFLLKFF